MAALSLNRYFCISNERKEEELFTLRKSWIYIAGIWTLSFMIALIHFMYGAKVLYDYANPIWTGFFANLKRLGVPFPPPPPPPNLAISSQKTMRLAKNIL